MSHAKPSEIRPDPELTVIIVSYNTRELTLRAVETLLASSPNLPMRVVVFDNASSDGSAEGVAAAFPDVEVVASTENIGFARANNRVAKTVTTPYLCLLNPDTETYPGAMDALLAFAKSNPGAGIVGGRTVFPDGSLNPASCWRMISLWSLFTQATGLANLFPHSEIFNYEGIGNWQRDSVREVGIVVGCLLLTTTSLWCKLGGFDERYFMYGEDADLCLRASALGYRPAITPEAEIMHIVGASTKVRAEKVCTVMKSKATIIRLHWSPWRRAAGLALLWTWAFVRNVSQMISTDRAYKDRQKFVWRSRHDWLAGFAKYEGA